MATDLRVPALGESVSEATVATWFKKPGDRVAVDEMLCELETDKVTVEVPSPVAGKLAEIVAPEGTVVAPNALLAQIADIGDAGPEEMLPKAETGTKPQEGQKKMSGKSVDVMVPTLGESVTEATVATWFKKVGDTVAQDEMLCELETDKVSVEVPSPAAGVLAEILAPEGATVEASARLAVITEGAAGAASAPAAAPAAPAPAAPAAAAGKDVEDAPSAKKAMAEAGVSRDAVTGTGRDGRVMKEDVARAGSAPAAPVTAAPAPAPAQAPRSPSSAEDAAREERVKMTRLRATIARRLKDAQNTAAMLTTFNEVDMTNVMALRASYKDLFEKKHGVKLGFMGFFVKAVVHALKKYPVVNASVDGNDIVYHGYFDIGVAVGSPRGLVVPIIRNADQLSLAEIERQIADFGKRAQEGKLGMEELTGGTYTISNGGTFGSMMSTPIINPPQSAILGMHATKERAVVENGQVVVRPMMYLAQSYDHRIIDGREAVLSLVAIKEAIEDPARLLLDL